MRRNNSEIPQPQTLVADTRAPIATWTGPWTCDVWFQSAGRKNFHVIRVHAHREKVYLGLCENPGVWGANPASKEKVSAASSVVISPNCEVCPGSHGSQAALWAVAVECPYASARAVPAARPLSARTPRDARTTRGCAGCCSAECAARGDGVLQDQAGAGRQLVRGAARGGLK